MSTTPVEYRKRDFYFDNVKFILIVLVVLGHFVNIYLITPSMRAIYNVIYSFHMPLFIFISGYFSKSVITYRKSDVMNLLIPYFLFQVYHFIFTKITGLGAGTYNLAIPTLQNWYLIALFIWRLLIPYFIFFNRKFSIIFIFVFALGIGFIPQFNIFLGLYRTFYFMPFFVLGYFAPDIKELLLRMGKYKLPSIIFCFIILTGIFLSSYFDTRMGQIITYAYSPREGYNSMEHYSLKTFYPFIIRILGMISSITICWLFLFLIPAKETAYSKFGKNTFYVFLFHMFLVWPIATPYKPLLTELTTIVFSIIIAYMLSQDAVVKILKPLIRPDILFRKSKL